MSLYRKSIKKLLRCTDEVAAQVEDCMRHDIFHSTLDWQTPEQFEQGAKEAYHLVTVVYPLQAIQAAGGTQ